jgi:hypothetical protein
MLFHLPESHKGNVEFRGTRPRVGRTFKKGILQNEAWLP